MQIFKIMTYFCRAAFILTTLMVFQATAAETMPRTISWSNLLPETTPLEHPFGDLTEEQLLGLEFLVSTRNLKPQDDNGKEIKLKLTRQGLDVEELMSAYDRLEQEVTRRNQMTNGELEGLVVRLPGYALPLEHKDMGVKELLLVPYVGACIHVPPPPPNQIVYVNLNNAHSFQDLYEPVWITGRLSIKPMSKSLSFVDGSSGIDMAYSLDGIEVTPYED